MLVRLNDRVQPGFPLFGHTMELSKVTQKDGLALAHLINALNVAKFDNVGSKDMEVLVEVKRWVYELASKVAVSLKSETAIPAAVPADTTMKIKGMGPIGKAAKKKGKK